VGSKDLSSFEADAANCFRAVIDDQIPDKLQRRFLCERIRRSVAIPNILLLDALATELPSFEATTPSDPAQEKSAWVARYDDFLDAPIGRAYAEMRLALHAEVDFKGRFNRHAQHPPRRYAGVWNHTLEELLERVESANPQPLKPNTNTICSTHDSSPAK
jgi:hypothetical protein